MSSQGGRAGSLLLENPAWQTAGVSAEVTGNMLWELTGLAVGSMPDTLEIAQNS